MLDQEVTESLCRHTIARVLFFFGIVFKEIFGRKNQKTNTQKL